MVKNYKKTAWMQEKSLDFIIFAENTNIIKYEEILTFNFAYVAYYGKCL